MYYCRHAKLVTDFHNFIQITVNQYGPDYYVNTDCACVAKFTVTAITHTHIHEYTSEPDNPLHTHIRIYAVCRKIFCAPKVWELMAK